MSEMEKAIELHQNNINKLTKQINENLNINEKLNLTEKLSLEKDFLLTLYKLKANEPKIINNDNNGKKEIINNDKDRLDNNTSNNNNKYIKKDEKNFKKRKPHTKYKSSEKEYKGLYEIKINLDALEINSFTYEFKNIKIKTKFYKKLKKGNYIYFECSRRRKGCGGKCKYDINIKKWNITEECNSTIIHDVFNFEQFKEDYIIDNLNEYNMNYRKYQEYYVKCLFINFQANTYTDILLKFNNKFKCDFKLSQKDINDIKYLCLGINNKLDFYNLCKKIKIADNKKLEINCTDIKYKIEINKKVVERMEKIIVITTEKMRALLNDKDVTNYFIDITYKIIPYNQKPYKLLTISGVNTNTNTTNLCCLIGLVYEDHISLYYTFKYLNQFFDFNPKICNIDFSIPERKALLHNDLFKEKPIVISCFFHFSQSIFRKMKEFKLIKKKLTKYSFEILRNLELICFIKPCLINDYSKFLKKQFKKEEETKLYNYLNNNWLKKDPRIFNYYNLLNSNDKPSFFKEHLYLTNNIAECLHSKLNYYLPKRKINANDFLYGISNILNLNDIKTNQILRKDIITKTLFKISSNIKDKNFKWLTYDTFKIVEHDIFILDTGLSEFNEVNNNLASINNIANKEDELNDKESFFYNRSN